MPLFLALLQLQLWVLPALGELDVVSDGAIAPGLVAQGALMLVAALLAGWILLRADRLPASWLGFGLDRRVPLEIGAGLGMGSAALALVIGLLVLGGAYRYGADTGGMVEWLGLAFTGLLWLALPAAAEEAVFRGYLFRALTAAAGPIVAILATSALFAVVHGQNPNVAGAGLLNIFLAGVLLAVAVLRTGSLWFAAALHLGWNWAMAAPLDLPVSGLDAFDAPLYEPVATGPAWLTGGAFGPEGGLAGTAAAALLLASILWTTRDGGMLAIPGMDRGGDG